jgi:hypothetical protein
MREKQREQSMPFDELVQNKYFLLRLVAVLKQGDFFGEVAI